jgi:hypothetical protein
LPDFSWFTIPNAEEMYQNTQNERMVVKYPQWKQKRPNDQKIYQHLPLQDPPKFTQIRISALKICHLATLVQFHETYNVRQIARGPHSME